MSCHTAATVWQAAACIVPYQVSTHPCMYVRRDRNSCCRSCGLSWRRCWRPSSHGWPRRAAPPKAGAAAAAAPTVTASSHSSAWPTGARLSPPSPAEAEAEEEVSTL